jgi:cellulose synthase/poly-beta-1,6-N-acetylglucosamine synthase-like glycosyltransferase
MQVSILIPTRNRREALRQTLTSLREIEHESGDHEIIVIDNGSTDGTAELVQQEVSARSQVRYVHEPMPGLLSGRHRGAQEAQGEICAYLDDDVWVAREWLTGLKDAFRDPTVALVGGPSAARFEQPPPAWLNDFYAEDERGRYCGWLSLVDCGKETKVTDPCLIWGLNYAIRRSVLFDVGGFHPDNIPKALQRYQGDGETGSSLRVQAAGLKALYHPKVAVEHLTPASRLTTGYFEERAFYQGVCNSFTQIRVERAVPQESTPRTSPIAWVRQMLRDVVRGTPTESEAMRRRTSASYDAGYRFHQDQVRRDPQLLAWVLRDNFWDYQLPTGWESYMTAGGPPR